MSPTSYRTAPPRVRKKIILTSTPGPVNASTPYFIAASLAIPGDVVQDLDVVDVPPLDVHQEALVDQCVQLAVLCAPTATSPSPAGRGRSSTSRSRMTLLFVAGGGGTSRTAPAGAG